MELIPIQDLLGDRVLNAVKLFQVPQQITINPRCPVSKKLLENPCVSTQCSHNQRVELQIFLQYSLQQNNWECPFCKTKTQLKDIYIDFVLKDALLEATQQTEFIEIYPDRSYKILSYENDQQKNLVLLTQSINQGKLVKSKQLQCNNGMIQTSSEAIRIKTFTSFTELQTNHFSLVRFNNSSMSPTKQFSVPDVFCFPPDDNDTHVYSFQSFSWSNLPNVPNISNFLLDFTVVYTQKWTYIIGGLNYRLQEQNYCCRISKKHGLYKTEPMMVARHRFAYALMEDTIFVIGGISRGESLIAVECFDLDTQQWTLCPPINQPRAGAVAAAINEETIELIGGTSDLCMFILEIEQFRKSVGEWVILNVVVQEGIVGGVAFHIPDTSSILVFGGCNQWGPSDEVLMFNRARMQWCSRMPKMKQKLTDHWQYPVVYDKLSRFIHLFSGVQFPILHIFYSINFLVEQLLEEEYDRDESTVGEKNVDYIYI